MIITLDGPSGAGKSTVGRLLAKRLGFRYVDTGALYRAVAWWVRQRGLDSSSDRDMEEASRDIRLAVEWDQEGRMHVLCGSADISDAIRSEETGLLASRISAHGVVRETLWRLQRTLGAEGRMVFEGRDMGSQVFPNAEVRFFLTASLAERARRRFAELERGGGATLQEVEAKMAQRDQQDTERSIAPLTVPEGAIVIDTTALKPDEVVDRMVEIVTTRRSSSGGE